MKRYLVIGLVIIACNSDDGKNKDDNVSIYWTDSDKIDFFDNINVSSTDTNTDTVASQPIDTSNNLTPNNSDTDSESANVSPNQTVEERGTSSGMNTDLDDTAGSDVSDVSSDDASTNEVAYVCPEGSVEHTSASGETFCCSESTVFCDETKEGYTGGCWNESVACETITFCEDDWQACISGTLPFCDLDEGFLCYPCEDETEKYETTSGRPVCCPADQPTFCDENETGYSGGCWPETIDCETITVCGDAITACYAGSLPFCDETGELTCYPCPKDATQHTTQSGRPMCCGPDKPQFCDENEQGYPGGCWQEGVDCSTTIFCNGYWGICLEGAQSSCENDIFSCQ